MRVPTNKGLYRTYGRFYVVQFGDTLYTISQRFDVPIDVLQYYNDQIGDSDILYPGEVLFIPTPSYLSTRGKNKSKKRRGRKRRS